MSAVTRGLKVQEGNLQGKGITGKGREHTEIMGAGGAEGGLGNTYRITKRKTDIQIASRSQSILLVLKTALVRTSE